MGHYTNPDLNNNGVNGEKIPLNVPIYIAIGAFTAVAWFNVIELNIQVFLTFKRHRGLYFWSLLISSYGCVLHALGFLLKFFQLTTNDYVSVTIITIGWYAMVTGQAIVLYSRLHLVVREQRVLRAVLIMIIVDAICLHIPTTVLTYGSNISGPAGTLEAFTHAFNKMERVQMTCFCLQEFIISGIYVYSTIRLLRPVYHGKTRKVMMQLIWINLIIIGMDVVLLIMEYSNQYEIEATLKAMVYSIKLKLEFAVLNQLMTLANSSVSNATKLTLDDGPEQEKRPAPAARSKSITYLTRHYNPKRKSSRPKSPHDRSGSGASTFSWASFGANNNNSMKAKFDWVPSLDRKRSIQPEHLHIEDVANDQYNVFTNPAACFHPDGPKRYPLHDDLAIIAGSPTSQLSPTLTGSTLNPGNNHASGYFGSRRGAAPPRLDFVSSPPPQVGVLRSNRPSVSDWAHGPDSASSPSSSVHGLDPYELASLHASPAFRQPRGRNMGMDFMTSAL